ncbi:Brp/Blh family beta-carotene 15,15'-dioxygenase [Acuticoccus sp.]|uniref:Brp/Blh family beta-carotene 15,15'-dioxygenase n=1 Tax=Acuticoccus sp. TaxID=1904378 RepID=UPI003B51578D
MRRSFLATSLACVAAAAWLARLPDAAVWALTAVAVVAGGLPHGALDTRLARRTLGLDGAAPLVRFLALYVALAAAMALFFVTTPVAALVAFLTYAAVHFGRDWDARLSAAAVLGAVVVTAPAVRFEAEVAAIFTAMTGDGTAVAAALAALAPFAAGGALTVILLRRDAAAGVELGAYGMLALAVRPEIAFAVYFVLLHSPRHTREVCEALRLSTTDAARAAAPYAAAAALAGCAAAASWAGAGLAWDDAVARALFVGLACLTVPHMTLEMVTERPALASWARRVLVPSVERGEDGLGRRGTDEVMEARPATRR